MATAKELERYVEEQARAAAYVQHVVAPGSDLLAARASAPLCRFRLCRSPIGVVNGVCSGCFGLLNAGYSEAMLGALHAENAAYAAAVNADGWIDAPRATQWTHQRLHGVGGKSHDYSPSVVYQTEAGLVTF